MSHRPCAGCGAVVRDVDSTGEPGACIKCSTPSLDFVREWISNIREEMQMMTGSERVTVATLVMDGYCAQCGVADPRCQCWNDE